MSMSVIDREFIISNIQVILDQVHTHPKKRVINTKKAEKISFACPICGDSAKDMSKKRGDLYLSSLYYKCHNEDCRSTFTGLCKNYGIRLDPSMKKKIIDYIDTQFHFYQEKDDAWFISNFERLIEMKDLKAWMDSPNGTIKNFTPVRFGSAVYQYLLDRGMPKDIIQTHFYEGLKVRGKFSEPYVVFLNRKGDKVLGMQERNLKTGLDRRFRVWSFKDLYEAVHEEELDPVESVSYNKLSYLYNVLNIDFEAPITLFEGYTDSVFMPNSVGAVGLNTDYGIFTQNELDIRFFFDNDEVGKRKADEWLKKGYKVFLWEKYLQHIVKGNPDPHKYKLWFNNNVKDLNKLMQVLPCHWKTLIPFFSKERADTLYINYPKRMPFKKKAPEKNLHNYEWTLDIRR
jgi:transposase-like protein